MRSLSLCGHDTDRRRVATPVVFHGPAMDSIAALCSMKVSRPVRSCRGHRVRLALGPMRVVAQSVGREPVADVDVRIAMLPLGIRSERASTDSGVRFIRLESSQFSDRR